ncbi:MAG TPA: VOC family protein [Allosphingosinicella sp.]|uniref:VOC family protein n=1 Tax=Allosphingosinicella sp. TaxID=2823234 RepID=UPI002EDAF048
MAEPRIEHVNLSVSDPERTARLMEQLFGWQIRWQGPARDGGRTIHVGSADHYLALYTGPGFAAEACAMGRPLNHVGVVVDDLEAVEARVAEAGLAPFNHADYEPGRRFYFLDHDGIEYEVVSYAPAAVLEDGLR